MNSMWPSALASLDDSLAALDAGLQELEAANPVDIAQLTERLKFAAESSHNVRALLLSESPAAEWQDRNELEALFEAADVQRQRSHLLALAAELEGGSIVHRRAARVQQLNQLRSEVIKELRSLAAAEKAPPPLPGPEAEHWIDWACHLKEPDDTASLQILRAGFTRLDEFVADLEPGMWMVKTSPPIPAQVEDHSHAAVDARDLQQRRARLLALASQLERGEVVHHRTFRVTQVNQLREQAIQELRFQAVVARSPSALPGPEAEQWVSWACGLQEPEDAEALQILRDGFMHVDEFVANLEPDMWVPARSPNPGTVSSPPEIPGQRTKEQAREEVPDGEGPQVSPAPEESPRAAPAFATWISGATSRLSGVSFTLGPRLAGFLRGKWRILLPTAVLLLGVLGAMQWRLHRTHASTSPVKPAEATAPAVAESVPDKNDYNPNGAPANSGTHTPELGEKGAKPKDLGAAPKPATTPPEKPVSLLDDTSLRMPQAIP